METHLTFSVWFDKKCKFRENPIIDKIQSVLTNKRGWKKFGYNFKYIAFSKNVNFTFYFTSEETIQKICNLSGLSCADLNSNIIYINANNWRNGSTKSKLSLDDYRTYVINHEVGHIIGKSHVTCSGFNKVPVMVQQTLGIGNCKPNPWPLSIENPRL